MLLCNLKRLSPDCQQEVKWTISNFRIGITITSMLRNCGVPIFRVNMVPYEQEDNIHKHSFISLKIYDVQCPKRAVMQFAQMSLHECSLHICAG